MARVVSIARTRMYYGWIIAATGFASMFILRGIESFGLSVFVKPMSDELGWTRTMFSGVQSTSTLVSGIISFFVGPLIDRRGARGLMIFGALAAGAGFMSLSLVRGIMDFYIIRSTVITIGVACAGALPINVAIANWFIRKRGKATAIGFMGASVGGVVLVPVAAYLISNYGWRSAWVVLGIAVWLVIIPPVALFMKRRPEDIGLLPDGDADPSNGISGALKTDAIRNLPSEETWTRSEAVRTAALWLTILAFGLSVMGGSAMSLHFFSLLTDIGLSASAAATAISIQATSSTLAKISMGIIVDRFHVRHCGIVAFVLCAAAFALFTRLSVGSSFSLVYFTASFAGIATGGTTTIQEVFWANYFGRLSLGAIRSIAYPFSIIFSAGGPLFAGWAYDRFGNYQLAFTIFSCVMVVAAGFIYLARPPKETPKEQVSLVDQEMPTP